MNLKLVLLPILSLALFACSKDDDGKKGQDGVRQLNIPEHLTVAKPALGPELTKSQVRTIKKRFGQKPQMTMPELNLIWPTKDADREEIAWREAELKARDPKAYALMLEMRRDCSKKHNTVQFDSKFPDNSSDLNQLEDGDRFNTSATGGIRGDRCPVLADAGVNAKADVSGVNGEKLNLEGGAGLNTNVSIRSETYARLLGTRGFVLNYGLSAGAIVRKVETGVTDRALAKFNLSGKYLALNEEVPLEMEIQFLFAGPTRSELAVNSTLTFKDAVVQVVALAEIVKIDDKDETTIKALYLNGRETTIEDLQDLLGEQNLMIQMKQIKTLAY